MTTENRTTMGEAHQAPGGWREIWRRRDLPGAGSSTTLSRLLAVDGFDGPFAGWEEGSWIEYVERRASDLRIAPGDTVFDVGCGAGAFLYVLHGSGCKVGGIDWSPRLVEIARGMMPDGDFEVAEARALDVQPEVNVAVSSSVFLYFPSLEYAEQVIERMAAKATRAVAILDVPDAARKAEALEYRRAKAGGEREYTMRYQGLEHRHYDRQWLVDVLRAHGINRIEVHDQDLANYGNARFRFNAWGFKAASRVSP